MKGFPFTLPKLTPQPDGKHWWVHDPGFAFDPQDDSPLIIIPGEWMSDLTSSPKFVHGYVGPWGPHGMSALTHDGLYHFGEINGRKISRKEADDVFMLALKLSGVRLSKRRIMYRSVRIGGWRAWKKHRKADKKRARG